MTYRTLTLSDYPAYDALRTLALDTWPAMFLATNEEEKPVRHSRFEAMCASSDNFIVGAFDNDQLIGMAGFMTAARTKRQHVGGLWGMAVHPEWHGKGVGFQLVETLLNLAKKNKRITKINLGVTAGNNAAKTLYERAGFKTYGIEPAAMNVSGQDYDEVLMAYKIG